MSNQGKIEALWQMMGSMYGHKWVSSFGAQVDPDRVWAATLKNVTPEQVKEGLQRLAKRGDEWPPSAPEFRKLCLDDGEHWEHKAMRIRSKETDAMLRLPKPEIDKNIGRTALDELKQKLGVKI